MNKILKSISVIAFVAAIAVGSTSAYFTSSVKSEGNTFAAGTLTLTKGTETFPLGTGVMKPGDTRTLLIPVGNGGTLPLTYTVAEPLTVSGVLFGGENASTAVVTSGATATLQPGDIAEILVTVTMPPLAGNEYQGATGTVTVTVNAQ